MLQKLLSSPGVRQILGAGVGILIALGIYGIIQMLPTSAINKGLLINPTSLLQKNVGEVSVNNKRVDSDELKRLEARAAQVAAALQNNGATPTSVVPTETRADRAAWIAMRAAVREKNAIHDLAPHAAAATVTDQTSDVTTVAAPMEPTSVSTDEPVATTTALPNSGLGLNLLLSISVLGALAMIGWGKMARRFV